MNDQYVLERAKQIAARQGWLASSPAEVDAGGSVTLCAASCIARAALELYGTAEQIADFNRRVCSEDKMTLLPNLFSRCGLSPNAAVHALKENDARPPRERLEWFLSLRSIAGHG